MIAAFIRKEFGSLELERALNPQSIMTFCGSLENEKAETNGGPGL